MLFSFNYDTPVVMKKQGELDKLKELMNKIYSNEERAQERSDLIAVETGGQREELSYSKLCCNPKYRRATLVGCTLLVFQQLTGINVIMFYSNMLFKGFEMSATTVTALIGIVNFVATLFGLMFLACAGRKIIMLIFNAAMALTLYMLAVFAYEHNTWGMVICVLLFIAFFEFSSGPISWLYAAEIMQDKAVSIGTFLNWSLSLVISITIPLLVKRVPLGTIFMALGVFTTLGTLFVVFFMRETRGKTQEEIDAMFNDEEEEDYDRMMD
uniref:Major facilitator superfamily (MFS) profile domain-containing protein n=1 Tax=Strombidium inclinatum TaxID=197538 RepID=A0A7S3IVE3_9SPIT|mmetsp:Transcript_39690/g.60819  ORF Transcript_39690/g.60819 Transcript_39690/m.60819 type:complete len:269 (+) Transcript_39690:78-884(+)